MSKVEITRADGKKAIMGGTMDDKLFAHLRKAHPDWTSYRVFDDGERYQMTDKDKELQAYYDRRERTERAMKY